MPHDLEGSNRLVRTFAGVTLVVGTLAVLGGCATAPSASTPTPAREEIAPTEIADVRSLRMFDGTSGAPVTWEELRARVAAADIVLLGETHDHTVTHRLQQAVVNETLEAFAPSAVAMEMFERDHQDEVDSYLAGSMDLATFIERTGARRWEYDYVPGGTWENHYQPMIDAAKRTGSTVVAANAPRKYVRLARVEGYDALLRLPPEDQAYFDIPIALDDGEYRRRFDNTMAGLPGVAASANPDNDSIFRSQQTWDATMATSVVRAWNAGARKVLLAVGAFHVNWKGGIYGQIRQMAPDSEILVITVVPRSSDVLEEDLIGAGDIVVYGGPGPKRPQR